jgi:hypothetical protein
MISQTQLNRIHRAARQIGRRGRIAPTDIVNILAGGTDPISGSVRNIGRAIQSLQGPQRYSTRTSQSASAKSGRGKLLDAFLEAISAPDITLADIQAAADLLSGVGYRVSGPGTIEPPSETQTAPTSRRIGPAPRAPVGAPPLPGEESGYGQEIATPNSTNVYSFSFVPYGDKGTAKRKGTLYVTFKAPRLHASRTSRGRGAHGGRVQLLGSRGVLAGKTNSPGAMYSYDDVPVTVYNALLSARSKGGGHGPGAGTPGTTVWDKLRIRGSVDGARYSYRLVQGAVITQKGVSGQYVPRKATRRGFITRSLADLGGGRRGFISSTLPSQRGFSTRRGA